MCSVFALKTKADGIGSIMKKIDFKILNVKGSKALLYHDFS
jgi:hypothetical protein